MSLTSRASEAPAILQLHKWGASGLQLNLSQFREAFLSPTRELLLLLSYQREALLLPLVKDDAVTTNDHHGALQNPGYLDSYSPKLRSPSKLDLQDDISITSETIEIDYPRSNGYQLVCDVNSLAWGICGDSYDQHEAALFREILVVSGNHGVTVHAFRQPPETVKTSEFAQNGESGGGKWVEWGPSTTLPHCSGVDRTQRVGENLDTSFLGTGEEDSSIHGTKKRWMRSFLTNVDTSKSKGYYWTRFPESSQYPSSAVVVSFGIFDSDSGIWRFLFDRITNSNEKGTLSESDRSICGFSYKCKKVFASSSYDLLGFALTLVDPIPVNTTNESERDWRRFVLVARIGSRGIQWLSLVKLDEYVDNVPTVEWADFGFSDKFLVCLNTAGLLYFFGATTGDYVADIDISKIYGFHPQFHFHEEEAVQSDAVGRSTNIKARENALSCQTGEVVSKIMFRRLQVTSDSLMLAVIDDYGVVYVICANDHIPGIKYSAEKSRPQFERLGVGAMVGWQVGGAESSHQRPLPSLSPDAALLKNTSNFNKNFGSIELPQFQDGMRKKFHSESFITGFTSASQMVEKNFERGEVPSRTMRSIFVPTDRYAGDDIIFFSTFGITRLTDNQKSMRNSCSEIVHFNLYVDSSVNDDISSCSQGQRVSAGDAVGCIFQGCFYLVTEAAFSVVLPSISISSDYIPIEAIGYRQSNTNGSTAGHAGDLFEMQGLKQPWRSWKTEILDRVLLYEGHEEADRLCFKNDWDVKISRMRRLQVALDYLNYEEIEISLEILAGVSLAEEGVLRLLFAAVYLMFDKVGNDNEVSAASRLLALATHFAIKMIRKYGLLQQRKNGFMSKGLRGMKDCYPPVLLPDREHSENSRRLQEMAQFLETIRNLQCRLSSKFSRPSQRLVDGSSALILLDSDLEHDDAELSNPFKNALLLETSNQPEVPSVASDLNSNSKKLALVSVDSVDSKADLNLENFGGASVLAPEITASGRITFPFENPKDMIARWEIDNLDQKTIVKDALLSGRLPLAVLKLHLQHLGDTMASSEPHDTFSEVRDIGRAIAYDLFLKAETGLAVATLQKLGEDAESCLRQLVFGTVRRSLRVQVAAEMKRYGYLGPYDWKILEGISLIERVYPCCSFWRTYSAQRNELVVTENINSPEEIRLRMLPSPSESVAIACGDVDGVVLGSWTNVGEHSSIPAVDVDSTHAFYWAAAAVWSDAWNQRTIDRIVLGQPFLMGVNVLWESQLEYHICHNDWVEVSKLLDMIPSYSLSSGSLRISLENLNSTSVTGCNMEFKDYRNYVCSIEDLDAVCMDVPDISILRVSADIMCSMWLRTLMEKQLAKKFIFLKEYWEGTTEIVRLLAQSGFITCMSEVPLLDQLVDDSLKLNFSNSSSDSNSGAPHGLHKLVVYHCSQHNFPNLLDLYLDHHKLALNNEALSLIQDAVGDNQWAKWLLLLRVKGNEYDASFSNARSIASHNLVPGSSLAGLEIHDLIRTVDDIAEGAGELAAIATLMYAPVPIQDCLSTGSVNRHHNSSAQCTLESLRPAVQRFPTMWRTLVAACFGQDPTFNYLSPRAKVFGSSKFSEYLNWRDSIFYSTGHDTSLLQMLPGWFSKAVRRLIQLYVQGPLGWQSLEGLPAGESFLLRDIDYVDGSDQGEISTMSWEAAIQRHVEEQLYGSSVEGSGLGLEHHLHRGRALAAFNHLLSVRVQKLKLETGTGRGNSGSSAQVQSNVQSDVHTLLAPVVKSEEPLLSSVIPLAIMHFEDSVLVASCTFLLELCGLSASMLQIDIASLRRISSFYKSSDSSGCYGQLSPKDSTFPSTSLDGDITDSLARALAEDYLKHGSMGNVNERDSLSNTSTKQPSRALMVVLQHLEKASLPVIIGGTSCGSWLMNGNGDGTELRAQQKAASQHWNLVTAFCRMHQIHLSTKYLAALARDNDWVGFLSEAQVGGYPFETTIQVASKEFNDPRLKVHISTVLKAMQSRKDVVSSSSLDSAEKIGECSILEGKSYIPIELFGIIADCEKQVRPGEALLLKAKDLCWSLLAMIASCFPDVSPLSCLTVWLEITAARETSSIKVNDIASQIANNVGAAVEATNLMSVSGRPHALHYNRRNSKRRRLLESTPLDILTSKVSDVSTTSSAASLFALNNNIIEDEREKQATQSTSVTDEASQSLSKMVAVLCEQRLFLPLLRAFEMFLPSCSLLPFIRALQAFSQMRLSEASVHLGSFSSRIKEESLNLQTNIGREGFTGTSWISSTAVKASDAMLSTCPSPYERRCLLQLLIATDFGDGGSAMTYYRRLYWKINLAEPSLRKDDGLQLGNESLDDASLLEALEMNGHWEQARNWAKQLEASGGSWKSAAQHVTEKQAESMVAEWKEFLWDVPEERVALWGHCQTLFLRYSFPPLQAGLFFLKHAEAVEKDLPAKELHELLLLSLQWLSGMITQSTPVYPLHLLREIETRAWLLAVESEAQLKSDGDIALVSANSRDSGTGKSSSIIDHTASIISKMDNHINTRKSKVEKNDARDYSFSLLKNSPVVDASFTNTSGGSSKLKRRSKGFGTSRRPLIDTVEKNTDSDDSLFPLHTRPDTHLQDENIKMDISLSRWEESIGPQELERAVLSLLEFGQITAARQLQHKLSPAHIPSEFVIVDAALKLASASTPCGTVAISMLDEEVRSVIKSYNLPTAHNSTDPMQVLENLISIFTEGRGRGLCRRILSVVKAANVLGISFSEAFGKQPVELLQLLSLKAQDSFEEAYLLVQTHSMPAASIAQILAESFLKGLLAAHRGGYIDSQKDEGPAPLLWRFSDFLTWAELCPSEPEVGHALMRLVITGQEIPHACEVELLILSHHFYKSSACLDGVDVLVALAATRVEAYVSEGDFPCLARLITGVGNFHALNFILGILIENGQLDLLLQKYSAAADANSGTAEAVRGFRMAVLTSLKQFNPNDLDAFAMVYNHFDMKHETASLLESRAEQSAKAWFLRYDKDQNEDLLESMRFYIEAAEVHSSIDAGNKTRAACAQASLVSLQIRMPDIHWLNLTATNARRVLVEQSRFQEALIVAEAYGLNQPGEWALVLWNQMLKPELTEQFVEEFVTVLPLHPTMLVEIARFYRSEVAARGDQSHFSVWLTGGGLPADWAKYLGRSFRCLLKRTRDLRLRLHLATLATGFVDVIDACAKALDRVPDNGGPLVLRKGHGGAYLPLM